ncbi:hypothetical protein [Haloarcula marina]|uniref:hypothetical protein n=1 Tax=Haloarcula marina TaxID=2961574 RepID=UPI0020B6FE0C|nr:hypothetical protein [Halomicroarcula marina]
MGVRPPANDSDEPDVIEFGIAALDARLADVDVEYPTDAEAVSERLGHVEIPYDATGHTVTLDEALGEATVKRYDDEQELLNALHPVFERKRQAAANSILSQLRSLVPF